jgi:hypothetical protein
MSKCATKKKNVIELEEFVNFSVSWAPVYCLLFTHSSKVILALTARGAGWPWPEKVPAS